MSERWDPLEPSIAPEFFVSVEIYLSTAAASALPKPIPRSKRREKFEISASAQPEERKVKEKSSWLALSKGLPEGPWRPATCKLSGEGERCLLNIYLDKNRLYQTVYVHLLNQTDLRQADVSLFDKKDCLSIYCIGGQRWTSTHTAEPIYLHFSSNETCNTWLVLLRSYAVPEIYGRLPFPNDGGSYRMWRQLELTVVQGRGLGIVKLSENRLSGDVGESDDFTVSCHVLLNSILCGRTSEKKAMGSPDWLENFTFSDLPPFDSLVLLIRRDKKMTKTTTLGSVLIPLVHFRRGEVVEGWFPILHSGSTASDFQVGELRLKILVNEEIILPQTAYASLLQTLSSRNFLDLIDDFENKLKMKNISPCLMSLAIDQNVVVSHVQEFAAREVNAASPAQNTLFRGNTTLSRIMELCMNWYGKAFLEASVGGVIRKLCREKIAIEVDPARRSKGSKDIERNFELLTTWCQEFLDQIYAVRTECPQELRCLFETLRILVERRFRSELSKESHKNMQYRCVTAFCFLRFIVPAILNPHLFGFHLGSIPPPQVHRSLTLIAKVLQSLANLNTATTAVKYMRGMAGFISDRTPAMIDYILVVSTANKDQHNHQVTNNKREHREIETYLHRRSSTMRVLDKEAVPRLPDLLDIPRHLAVITSAVIRNSAEFQTRSQPYDPADQKLDEICSKCLDVEEQALLRVSQLSTKISSSRQLTSPLGSNNYGSPRMRPSTAPSPVNINSPFGRPFYNPSSCMITHNSDPPYSQHTRVHLKSTSTDSIPSYGLSSQPIDADPTSRRARELFNLKAILRR
ncbi:Ras GTPase-activating protein gap-2 [Termitomyces sp. J132]|nr:Ras GTPase-activating protein gap-2 [Termitomyces sp. J132]